jgi:two-component system, response regulator PdtaR
MAGRAGAGEAEAKDLPALRVLVVEDEALIAMDVEAQLADAGCVVVGIAATLRQAQAIAACGLPDVAVVDLNLLDGKTGLAVAEHLSAVWGCGIVMATANPEAVRDAPFVQRTLPKPYRDAALLEAVAAAARQVGRPAPGCSEPLARGRLACGAAGVAGA